MIKKEAYLGDGVYATFNGWHVVLDIHAQGSGRVVLEPEVLQALFDFIEDCNQQHQQHQRLTEQAIAGKANVNVNLNLTERHCHNCGQPLNDEEAWVDGEIWCHPCADKRNQQLLDDIIKRAIRDKQPSPGLPSKELRK
jgi:Zn finger protein HypA/HybF involved in hydrogenase expression